MTWALTPEEEFNPLLLPPVAMEYQRPLPEAEVPYIVGSPDLNKWYGGESGPVSPVMRDQRPAFNERLRYGRGKMPSAYEADYPISFFPEVVDSYEAMFNRQPAASTQERLWRGSDARVDMTFAPRRSMPDYNGGVSGLGETSWYETPFGSAALAVGTGVTAFLLVSRFLDSRARR